MKPSRLRFNRKLMVEMKQREREGFIEMNQAKTVERFNAKISILPSGCWEWQGRRTLQGYGIFKSFKQTLAHRISFLMYCGPLPEGSCVLHRCDNPPCVNPEHLFLGDRDVNNKDRTRKGRTKNGRKELTHCKRGHEFNAVNSIVRPNGTRLCRICRNAMTLKAYYNRHREKAIQKYRDKKRNAVD